MWCSCFKQPDALPAAGIDYLHQHALISIYILALSSLNVTTGVMVVTATP